MSKKILFMSSAKLTAFSVSLLLAVFCTIGMSFRPVYDEDEAAEIVMHGPRHSHWTTSSTSCGSTTYTYHNKNDYGKAVATVVGGVGGTVSLSGSTTGAQKSLTGNGTTTATLIWSTNVKSSDDTDQTGDDEVYVTAHTNTVTFTATLTKGYKFLGWYSDSECTDQVSDKLEFEKDVVIPGGKHDKNITSEATWKSTYGDFSTQAKAYTETYYAKFEAIPTVDITFLALPSAAYGNYVITYDETNTTVATANVLKSLNDQVVLTANPNGAYLFDYWYTEDGEGNQTILSTDNPLTTSFTAVTKVGAQMHLKPTHLNMTFKAVELDGNGNPVGSYTVNSTSVSTADYVYNTGSAYGFSPTLIATPAEGYMFAGWYTKEGKKKTYLNTSSTWNATFEEEIELYAGFVLNNYPEDQKAQFKVGSNYYTDLNAANTAAGSNGTIVCTRDGILPPGNYTISSGVKLYIPWSTSESYQTAPDLSDRSAPALSPYRTLTMVEGANINCNGIICVGGRIASMQGGNFSGYPVGACGVLDMSRGGHIELNEDAILYAWGFVKGQDYPDQGNNTIDVGTITANSGSKVYEDFNGENRGGSACSDLVNNSGYKSFPFQGYAIQNIEVPVTYKFGSTLQVYTALYIQGTITKDFPLISNSKSLFLLKNDRSTVTKWYDPSTDLACYQLSGSAQLDAIKTKIYVDINSADFNLPISSNMHIIFDNCNMTLSNPVQILPDAVIEIRPNATANLESNLFLYDVDDWQKGTVKLYFASFKNLTSHKNRGDGSSKDNLSDAKLIVDGTLNVTGKIYSTTGGANIMGNGGGKIIFPSTLASSSNIYQLWGPAGGTQTSTSVTISSMLADDAYLEPVAVNQANLYNENDSYTKSIASSTFHNVNGRWFVAADKDPKDNHTYKFSYITSGAVSGTGGTSDWTPAVYSWDKTTLELGQKWMNVSGPTCDTWWTGIDTYFYNWTLESAWHQFMPTATTDLYSGSNNKIYTKTSCVWEELGETDVNCLYTINDVKKALVDGQFIALEPNNNDPAYHAADNANQYYICFEGCNWHAADKYTEAQKAYIIVPDTFIWYNNAWMSVNFRQPFAYTLDETNVPIYYEYLDGEWVLAEPYVRVVDGSEDRPYWFLADAFAFASNSVLRKAPTIKILRDISGITTAVSYTGTKTCTLDLNGCTITGSVSSMLTINGTGCTFIIEDNNTEGKEGKINLYYSYNGRRYAVNVTKGHLKLKSGTISSINTLPYATGQTSTTSCAIIVKASQQCTIEGGKVYAQADHNPFGIYGDGNSSTITVKGGEVIASVGAKSEPRGIQVTGGTLNVQDDAVIEATTYAGGTTGEGILVNSAASYFATLNMTGGIVKSTTKNSSIGILVNYNYTYDTNQPRNITAQSLPVANISGGEIQVMNANGATAEGVRSFGTTNISGGKITVRPTTTTAFGVRLYAGKTTISETADIDVSATSTAYGVRISQENPYKTGGLVYNGTLEMTGGTLTVRTSSTTDAYGVYVGAGSLAQTHANDPSSSTYKSYYAGNYANAGTATISGGVIDVQARTNKAYAVYVAEPVSQSGATGYETATATPNCSITGGKFKVASMTANATNIAATNVSTSTYTISDGYYNNQENVETYTTTPKHVVELPTTDANYPEYLYKVANSYLVTFMNGSETLQSTYQEEGKVPTYTEAEPTKASAGGFSYAFNGWSTSNDNTPAALTAVTSAGATYYACFEQTDLRYTISLDATTNGGECATEYIRVAPGAAAGELPSATKEGHTFTGWFTAASGGTQLTASTVVPGDITYYAQFTVNSYTLTYALGEGKVTTAGSPIPAKNKTGTQSQSVAYGTAITAPVVARTGYTFQSWDAIVAATMPAEDVTYTPLWIPNVNTKYTVNHYQQNVDGTYPTTPFETESLTGTTATSVTPDVKSYDGFVSPATQTVTIAADGTTVVEYQYARQTYTISLDAYTNGGTSDAPDITIIHGATIGTVPPDAQKGCNDFLGWFTKPVGGVKITSDFVIEYDMKKLYAQFSDDVRTYPITYLAGANGIGTIDAGVKTCGVDAVLTSATFTRTGYTQTGWSTTDGGAKDYDLGGAYTANAAITLYPFWTVHTHAFAWDFAGGSTSSTTHTPANNALAYGSTISYPANNTMTKTGYTFSSWSSSATTMPDQDLTITANWSAVTYNLTYEGLNGATNSNPATYTIETATITLANPGTRAGYAFTGWTCGGNPITQIALGSTGDKVITANWEQIGVTILWKSEDGGTTLETDEGVVIGATPSFNGETPTKPTTAEYTYTFDGWTTEANGDGTYYATDDLPTVSAAATYYAHFAATANVASVKVGSAEPTYYTTIDDAFAYVNTVSANMTITLLQDAPAAASLVYQPTSTYTCTLDLNNHTISGAFTKVINVNKSNATLTITDNSTEKGGKIITEQSLNGKLYGLFITAGKVNLNAGTIECINTLQYNSSSAKSVEAYGVYVYSSSARYFTMTDGTVKANATYKAYGVYSAGTTKLKGGKVIVSDAVTGLTRNGTGYGVYVAGATTDISNSADISVNTKTVAYGIYVNAGTANATGGVVLAKTASSTKAYGVHVNAGTFNAPEGSTTSITADAYTTTAYAIGTGASGTANIYAGTYEAKNTKSSGTTTYGVYSSGTTNIHGGTFTVSAKTSTARAIGVWRNTTTVDGNPVFNVSAPATVYGATASGTTPSKKGAMYSGTLIVNGGTFNVTATSGETAYGVYAYAGTGLSMFSTTNDSVPGNYISAGEVNVNDGIFNVKAKTKAYGIVVSNGTQNKNTAYDSRTAYGQCSVSGGKFKVETTDDANATAYAMNKTATAEKLVIEGGYYNTKRTNVSTTSNIEDKYTAPMKEDCNYYVLDLPSSELPYKYEVAEAYTVTFDANGHGTAPSSQLIEKDQKATEPTAPTAEGWNFEGWYKESGCTNAWNFAMDVVEGPTTLYAKWTLDAEDRVLDIVDWEVTGNKITGLTINANGLKTLGGSTDWKVRIGETEKDKDAREANRTLKFTGLSLDPGEELLIQMKAKGEGEVYAVESQHTYTVPYVHTASTTMPENFSGTVYVNQGTWTIEGPAEIENLYVAPGASVNITSGGTLTVTGKLVLRTLPWASAAINGSFTAGQTFITRIGPDMSTHTGLSGTYTYKPANYYPFGLPVNCDIDDVTLSDNTIVTYGSAWLLKEYNEETRAQEGATDKNWYKVSATDGIKGGKGYLLYSNVKYYREFYFPITGELGTSVPVSCTTDNTKGTAHQGWNMICSPLLGSHTASPKPEQPTISLLDENGDYLQHMPSVINPALPFFYQATAAGTLAFGGTSEPRLAPRRVAADEESTQIQWMHIDLLNANGQGDETSIYSHPTRYEETYKTGIDVAKQSLTASRAIIYSSHAYGAMAFAGVSDEQMEEGIALTVYNPTEQELTFSLRNNAWLSRMAYVWLTDTETGTTIDLLDSDYTLTIPAGTTSGRFVLRGRFFMPMIPTDVDNVNGNKQEKARKLLINEKMYIQINGRLYDATGKIVKGK